MSIRELYKKAVAALREAGVPDSETDARILLEQACGVDFTQIFAGIGDIRENADALLDTMLQRRITGEPLQYILGSWDFMGFTFAVGEGVLIPRSETEVLTQSVIDRLKAYDSPVVFDLCSGSGCIGLSIKKLVPSARVFLVEKSLLALNYLNDNRAVLGLDRTTVAVQGDILAGFSAFSSLPEPDVIVSNPPYIESAELPTLQREVQKEPSMALDGGADGLLFYRCLCEKWYPFIKNGGFMAVECGENQPPAVAEMLPESSEIQLLDDYAGTQRFVIATKMAK